MSERAQDWLDQANLDQYYIPTRYPDAQPAGAPFRFFTAKQAEEALQFAERFIEKAESEMPENRS